MGLYEQLVDVSSTLKDFTTSGDRLTVGDIILEYHDNGRNLESLAPLLQVQHVMAEASIEVRASQMMNLSFYVIQDTDALEMIHRLMAPHLEAVPPTPPAPRLKVVRAQNNPAQSFSVMQLSIDPSFVDPYLYFIFRPLAHESLVILKEGNRRANYAVTEVLLDMLLAHSNLFGMHASAVNYRGRGLAFSGDAGAGKTSLTLAFIRRGARFLSDDLCIVCPDHLLLAFEHKQLTLRSHAITYLAKHGVNLSFPGRLQDDECEPPEEYSYMSDIFDRGVYGTSVQLNIIALPCYRPDRNEVQLVPLELEEAVARLRPSLLPWTMQWEDAYGLCGKRNAVLAQLTQLLMTGRVSVVSLEYGRDIDQAVERVARYLDSRTVAKGYHGDGIG